MHLKTYVGPLAALKPVVWVALGAGERREIRVRPAPKVLAMLDLDVLGMLRGPDGVSSIGYRGVNGVWVGSTPRMLSTK